jgi:hypothetical protein
MRVLLAVPECEKKTEVLKVVVYKYCDAFTFLTVLVDVNKWSWP